MIQTVARCHLLFYSKMKRERGSLLGDNITRRETPGPTSAEAPCSRVLHLWVSHLASRSFSFLVFKIYIIIPTSYNFFFLSCLWGRLERIASSDRGIDECAPLTEPLAPRLFLTSAVKVTDPLAQGQRCRDRPPGDFMTPEDTLAFPGACR